MLVPLSLGNRCDWPIVIFDQNNEPKMIPGDHAKCPSRVGFQFLFSRSKINPSKYCNQLKFEISAYLKKHKKHLTPE